MADFRSEHQRFARTRALLRKLVIKREWFARGSTALGKLVLVIAGLAMLGVFWRPGLTLWGLGTAILIGTSAIAGFVGMLLGGRINLYTVELGRHLRENVDENDATPRPRLTIRSLGSTILMGCTIFVGFIGLGWRDRYTDYRARRLQQKAGGEKSSSRPTQQTGPMNGSEIWVGLVDPVWAGGLGYPIANLLASKLGLAFGYIPAMQALLSDITGLRRCDLLYERDEQPSKKWHIYAAWTTALLMLLSGAGLVLALLGVPLLGINRGAFVFYTLVPLNTGLQALWGPWRWARKHDHKLDGPFWKQFLAGMLPILGGILFSAVCGITVAELIGHAFSSVYSEATYGHLLMYHYVQNFLSILGQETTQVIIGGIGVQMLLNPKLRPVYWRVWGGLVARAFELFRDWLIGLVTLRWLRSQIRKRRRSN
ncbi:hypothetical protein KSX_62080 [Ktedonospora formicarum]|uniref:Uncharacterized protein n=1 Tax=Ktedonospora formicarum TaxID=2778364 RepID=A0A8J3I727_9CHLR|nr:hypothetical protein KSX_62080 [Ktedonospora formicarum]